MNGPLVTDELFTKSNRAWLVISNVLYQHKKLAVHKAQQLFDSLIKPIFPYAAKFWLPFIIPKKRLESQTNLIKCWESFHPELLNQKVYRLPLSVHKQCSWLAMQTKTVVKQIPNLCICFKNRNSAIYILSSLLLEKNTNSTKKRGIYPQRKVNVLFHRSSCRHILVSLLCV